MDVLQMVFAVVIDDALAFSSGNVAPSSKPMIVYCRVPHTMAEGGLGAVQRAALDCGQGADGQRPRAAVCSALPAQLALG